MKKKNIIIWANTSSDLEQIQFGLGSTVGLLSLTLSGCQVKYFIGSVSTSPWQAKGLCPAAHVRMVLSIAFAPLLYLMHVVKFRLGSILSFVHLAAALVQEG